MKKKDLQILRSKDMKSLRGDVGKKKLEIIALAAKIKAGQEKNVKKFKNMRKDIAQILTIIKEKEILEGGIKK